MKKDGFGKVELSRYGLFYFLRKIDCSSERERRGTVNDCKLVSGKPGGGKDIER